MRSKAASPKSSKAASCLSCYFLSVYYQICRIENSRIEGPKSRSGESKSEVWRVQNRGLEGFLAALGAAGRSWDHPEGVVRRLGAVLGALWVRLGEPGGRLWGVLGIVGRCGASNGGKMRHSILHAIC